MAPSQGQLGLPEAALAHTWKQRLGEAKTPLGVTGQQGVFWPHNLLFSGTWDRVPVGGSIAWREGVGGEGPFLGHILERCFHSREAARGPQGWSRATLGVSVGPSWPVSQEAFSKGLFFLQTPSCLALPSVEEAPGAPPMDRLLGV